MAINLDGVLISASLCSVISSFSKCLFGLSTLVGELHGEFCLNEHGGRHSTVECIENGIYGQESVLEALQGKGLAISALHADHCVLALCWYFLASDSSMWAKQPTASSNSVMRHFFKRTAEQPRGSYSNKRSAEDWGGSSETDVFTICVSPTLSLR